MYRPNMVRGLVFASKSGVAETLSPTQLSRLKPPASHASFASTSKALPCKAVRDEGAKGGPAGGWSLGRGCPVMASYPYINDSLAPKRLHPIFVKSPP
jgi:hypothetical protein